LRIRALVVAIFLVGLGLRVHRLAAYPHRMSDEYAWTWCGMTLLSDGEPRSWSWMPAYGDVSVTVWRGDQYRLVEPWFDHPPLYPLYVGAFMHAAGTHDIFGVATGVMRLSNVPLFAATFFLLFLVARRLADETHALVAIAFFAVAPTAVWSARLVMAEELVLALALAGWYALQRYGDAPTVGRRRAWLVAVGVAAALLPLSKVAGLAFVLFYFTAAIVRRDRRLAVVVCIGGACGLAAYAAYGAHYDWALFRAVQEDQASRFENFGALESLVFASSRVADKAIMELPFILGFMTLLFDLRDGRNLEMGLFAASYAITIAFLLPYNHYGWYAIPLHPAFAFGLGSFVVRAWRDASAGALWTWMIFSLTYLAWLACDAELVDAHTLRWYYLAVAVALPFAWLATAKSARRWRVGFGALVALQCLGEAVYAFRK
jgi:4-amino-4-deoxy-L-arabinose transferase-like glycosyltransferase